METILEMRRISKVYPGGGSAANRDVSLDLRRGEILCLAGENGAGKSTLMKILYGLIPATEGEIRIRGKTAAIHSPLDANRLGIGMVHQHFMLFPEFTVAQNVVMGIEPKKLKFFFDIAGSNVLVQKAIDAHHFSIEAGKTVGSLTVGEMQQVEIVKMLYRNADILILDEPTAVLTDQETESLFKSFRILAGTGKSLILITHKLNEIREISDRVAVMRKGELIAVRDTADLDEREISQLMYKLPGPSAGAHTGRAVPEHSAGERMFPRIGAFPPSPREAAVKRKPVSDRAVLSFQDVTVRRRNQERPLLNRISFSVHEGEILAFAGVGGNGLGVLEAVLGGFLPLNSGKIRCRGEDISRCNSEKLRRRGLAYVPSDRISYGSAESAPVWENIIINRRGEFSRWGFLDRKKISAFTAELLDRYAIAGNMSMPLAFLSGGNIQKTVLAREIEQHNDYIVFCEPTRGLDASSSLYVYGQMESLRNNGTAVILISSNLDEILALADRIIVLYRGSTAAEIENPLYSPAAEGAGNIKEKIGAWMLGLKKHEPEAKLHEKT
ncbi:MAG: ATP-binding cassette domain-containing protein [Treponema sp.]|jgi:simple sugar transport system ATP-binding protein|nr:ATP-binding cassette domain-containing protein [Treponema sp.]